MRRCEALVLVKRGSPRTGRWEMNGMYVPCGVENAEMHHKITRARGGLILDQAGETYHQMWLCREHHDVAHDKPSFESGLLLRGYVTTGPTGKPLYRGPDEYLTKLYGPLVHTP